MGYWDQADLTTLDDLALVELVLVVGTLLGNVDVRLNDALLERAESRLADVVDELAARAAQLPLF